MKLLRSRRFRAALQHEYDFLYRRNPAAAEAAVERIHQATLRLKEFPQSGRSWRQPGVWELVIPGTSYIVVYRFRDEVVEILMLFHTSRDAPHVH